MNTLLTPSNITFTLGILGVLFTVYNYFRSPQIATDKQELITTQTLLNLDVRLKELTTSFSNHLVADQTAFQMLNSHIVEVDKSVVRLTTIIDERIPKQL